MKKMRIRTLVIGLLFLSCHKTNNQNSDITNAQITNGTWHVSLFTDSQQNETADFTGYNFSFGANGVLTVVRGSSALAGSWNKSGKFTIDLGAKSDSNKPLGELTDDWHIISTSANTIQLGDDNPASGELLTFTKN